MKYRVIPSAPSLTTPVTIIPSNEYASGFYNMGALLGASKNFKTSGNFSAGFNMRDPVGTAGTPIVGVNTAGDIIGVLALGTHAIQTNNNPMDYLYMYGLDPTNPFLLRTANNGLQIGHNPTGSHSIFRNFVIDSPGTSGTTFNFGVSTTSFYENIDLSYIRVFNAGQEGITYIGNTGASYNGTNYINTATVSNCYTYNSSREGTQFGHINVLLAYNNTIINSGQTGGAGQNGLIQVHDCNGTVRDSIYDGAPELGTFFTHGTTVQNCYFRWTNNNPIFVGRSDNAYFAAYANRLNGQPLLFNRCIFHCDNVGTLAHAATIEERTANVEFRDCIFSSNISALYLDNRAGGYSNTLVGTISTNGNSSASLTAPSYISGYSTYSNYLYHGLTTSSTYLTRHMGFRTV